MLAASVPAADPADVLIIGAGVVGTAIARTLSRYELSCVLVEEGNDVGTGTTKANTAILHTGFDAVPGSLESRLVKRGAELLRGYAVAAGIPVERTGAVLIAWSAEQEAELPAIQDKARRNGYLACRRISAAQLYEREPHLGSGALSAVEIPDESIICPWTTPLAYATEAVHAGVRLQLHTKVLGIVAADGCHEVRTSRGTLRCRWLVNAAGLHSDTIDAMLGGGGFTIQPRRGELIVFDKLARPLLGSILLPVPTPHDEGCADRADGIRERAARTHRAGRARQVRYRYHGGRTARSAGVRSAHSSRLGRRGGNGHLCRAAGGYRAPRLPDPGGRESAVRVRGRHPVYRSHRVARHRRVCDTATR